MSHACGSTLLSLAVSIRVKTSKNGFRAVLSFNDRHRVAQRVMANVIDAYFCKRKFQFFDAGVPKATGSNKAHVLKRLRRKQSSSVVFHLCVTPDIQVSKSLFLRDMVDLTGEELNLLFEVFEEWEQHLAQHDLNDLRCDDEQFGSQ